MGSWTSRENELADQRAYAGTQEILPANDYVAMTMDKKDAKCQCILLYRDKETYKREIEVEVYFAKSEKMEGIQETFNEVGKTYFYGENDRAKTDICGHSRLNGHQAVINIKQSGL